MHKRLRNEKIVEVKIHRLQNTLGMGTLQNGAWHVRHAGRYCDVDGADLELTHQQPLFSASHAWNMHRPPTNTQNSQQLD